MAEYVWPVDDLHQLVVRALEHVGFDPNRAQDAARVLMWASQRGVDTHGVRNLKAYYLDQTKSGIINPDAQIKTLHDSPHAARLDGDSGLGLFVATEAMKLAIQKGEATGIGVVTVRNAHHLGPAGYYASLALERGMLGVSLSGHFFGSGHVTGVAPINCLQVMLSTNPLAFAAPCGKAAPFILDMSTAVTTVNRIESFAQAELPIPDGWAKDAMNQPTNDPQNARNLFPLGGETETGGYKGVGLSMLVSILSGVLSGGWHTVAGGEKYDQPTMGHFFAAMRIDQFMPVDVFTSAMDAFVQAITDSPRQDSTQPIRYPGSDEYRIEIERRSSGIPMDERLWHELKQIQSEFE